jgi:hypothetical protein
MGATAVPVGPVTTVYVYLCSLVSATLFGWQLCHSSCSLFSYGFTYKVCAELLSPLPSCIDAFTYVFFFQKRIRLAPAFIGTPTRMET